MQPLQNPLVNTALPSLMAGSTRLKCIHQWTAVHAVMDFLDTLLYISPTRQVLYSTGQHVPTETSNWACVPGPQ